MAYERESVGGLPAGAPLRQDLLHDVSMYIGQPAIDSVLTRGKLLMIDAQQVENRGMEIVDGRLVLLGLITPVVAPAVSDTGLDSRTPEPAYKAAAVVVAAERSLRKRRATEFRGPDHERVVGQTA